jgi:parvulin-like peptidyl-prolyl isomerase
MPWSNMDADHRNALLLYAGIAGVIIFVVALIAFGYYQSKVKPNHETIMTIGSRKFSVDDLATKMRYRILTGQAGDSQIVTALQLYAHGQADTRVVAVIADFANSTLTTMEHEELTRQSMDALGVNVTQDNVDTGIKNAGGLLSGASRDQLAAVYRSLVLKSGLGVRDYRDIIAAQVIQQQYTQATLPKMPDAGPQVKMHLIKVATKDKATALAGQLNAGATFDAVAVQNSIDTSRDNGGDEGWVARGSLDQAVEDAAYSTPVGSLSDVITGKDGGFYLIHVDDRSDNRPLEVAQKAYVAQNMFNNILNDTKGKIGDTKALSGAQLGFIAEKLSKDKNILLAGLQQQNAPASSPPLNAPGAAPTTPDSAPPTNSAPAQTQPGG